jgi:DNA-binding transcriptional regulator YdaS (Cro superfamily)
MVTNRFKQWLKAATAGRKKEVAASAKTSVSILYQLGYGYRSASADLAARIETASGGEVTRADMNETCNGCKYFKECKK